jgi:flagellar biosynthetic protein FlhB
VAVRVAWAFDLQRFALEERSLPATARRRQRARERGQVARSGELTAGVALLAAVGALAATVRGGVAGLQGWAAHVWGHLPAGGLDVGQTMAVWAQGGVALARLAGPPLIAAALGAAAAGLAQTGLVLSLGPLVPRLALLNPLGGVRRIASRRSLVELTKAALKAAAVIALAWGPAWRCLQALLGGQSAGAAAAAVGAAVLAVLRRGAVLALAVGAADYLYQRYEHELTLRMTRAELREELRETEGDPAMRLRRRRRQRELARRRMLAEVRRADVVVANPSHYAVALRYDAARMSAPQVVARGVDFMAERIKAVARAAGVPVVDNPPLARSLYASVRVGQYIPATLYRAVAEVLAFVWRVQGRTLPGGREG